MSVRSIRVELGPRSYAVHVGHGLLADAAWLRGLMLGRQVLVVTNDVVGPLYLSRIEPALAGFRTTVEILPDGEVHKTLDSAGRLFSALARLGAQRDATIVALGGGVIGDLAGFAAACWMRGVRFVQIPTTLLAQVDASVGGKTAVNLPEGKNLVGAFHQPAGVICDIDTLATLPDREYRAGLAEVVKYGAIRDEGFFAWLERHAAALVSRDADALIEAVAHSVAHKAEVVAADEREDGARALLNFGHTFGHALEAAGSYRELLHGEAVAVGMLQAATLSTHLGLAEAAAAGRLEALLRALGLDTRPPPYAAATLLEFMRLDKKALSERLRLVLWRGVGQAEVVADVPDDAVLNVLAA
ncbi:MAG TPA: 3-dehydroquinate synthase [Xanthomonadaceae bacterium]|nr:3-dehydroquinate synthase [Xanthomonadaceae bacterium]